MRLCGKDVCYWKCGDTTCYRRACCPITKMGNFDDKSQPGWRKMISRTILLWPGREGAGHREFVALSTISPLSATDKQPLSEKKRSCAGNIWRRKTNAVLKSPRPPFMFANAHKSWGCESAGGVCRRGQWEIEQFPSGNLWGGGNLCLLSVTSINIIVFWLTAIFGKTLKAKTQMNQARS